MSGIRATISGSFRRALKEVSEARARLISLGVEVLSPRSTDVVSEIEGFTFFKGEAGSAKEIEETHLAAIANSDFLYVVNPGGYIGPSATMEIGLAVALSVPVFCESVPTEPAIRMFVETDADLSFVGNMKRLERASQIPRNASLRALQNYVARMVKLRGFTDESIRDVLLLLMEEVGELAKAARREIGLRVRTESMGKELRLELADCLIYLIDIANLAKIDLDAAFREKERINHDKQWIRAGKPK